MLGMIRVCLLFVFFEFFGFSSFNLDIYLRLFEDLFYFYVGLCFSRSVYFFDDIWIGNIGGQVFQCLSLFQDAIFILEFYFIGCYMYRFIVICLCFKFQQKVKRDFVLQYEGKRGFEFIGLAVGNYFSVIFSKYTAI